MAEATEAEPAAVPHKKTSAAKRAGKWLLAILAALVLLILAAVVLLNTSFGQRFIADQIAQVAPASGLKIDIGRIEGDIYGKATLHDVTLSDPKGKFLTVPVVELDWKPLSWLTSGLDVRNLTARRGTLLRLPELLPGDPDAPILPNFDIRIDRLELDDFTIAEGIAGEDAQRVDLLAKADIRDGRAYVETRGQLGEQDNFYALLDAEPDGDKFDLKLNYEAPQDGVIAGLAGLDAGYSAVIGGDGNWSDWTGGLLVKRDGEKFGSFRLTNQAGQYGIAGRVLPQPILTGLPADAIGEQLTVVARGTLEESVIDGAFALRGRAIRGSGAGVVDLANNLVERLRLRASLTDPELFGESLTLENARATANISGAFRDLSIAHELQLDRLVSGDTRVAGVTQEGTATYDGARWTLPLDVGIERVETGNALLDPRLVNGTVDGTITYAGTRLLSDGLRAIFPGLSAQLAVVGDTASGDYQLSGPVAANGLQFDNVGTINAGAEIIFRLPGDAPWTLQADANGRVANVTNDTLANLAGEPIRFSGGVSLGAVAPLVFNNARLDAAKLDLALDGRIEQGETSLAGTGSHVDYGDFTVEAALKDAGPEAVLVFASPLPAAGLKDVRVALAPTENGFAIDTEGQSLLGAFNGSLGLISPADGPTRISVEQLNIWKTSVTGDIALLDSAATGTLALSGGGLDGTIVLSGRGGGQAFDIDLDANRASFAGATPISIARARIDASGLIVGDSSTIEGNVFAEGLRYGNLFLGRLAATAELNDGVGTATASLAGRRGSRFALQLNAAIEPDRYRFIARGDVAGKRLSMPRRGVLARQGDGGWLLSPTQLSYADGDAILSGEFGGGTSAINLQLADMPLSLIDVAYADVGLGGKISGLVDFNTGSDGIPTGSARVKVESLTRSGLVLSSRPTDMALSLDLSRSALGMRAVIDEGGERRGRLQGRVAGLPQSGGLMDRLRAGDLMAQLRYSGPADALWRLAAIDAFDLTGPLSIAANVSGSISDPRVRGSLATSKMRVRSSLSGTDIRDITARGTFSGSRLRLRRFTGSTPNGGSVVGSGIVDLGNMGEPIEGQFGSFRGPQLDIRVSAKNAQLLDAQGLAATITGPLRIVSNGNGGTIAGRVAVDRASWALGIFDADVSLPNIPTREINVPADIAAPAAPSAPWRYLIDAKADSRVQVDGLGLESEWSADIILRGTTSDPRIGGEARVVRGAYSFAGTRFELERGIIDFDDQRPIDPRIDILAETNNNGIDVAVAVRGSATQPEITFSSTPALPEEEILARLLFGDSITQLSATDALQLGAALASLRGGGGGMDPINELRSAIGLDRLRIVGADPALNRGTGVALGKNLGRRFYVEIITDGRGYSATELEFRVTSWLSLLASVSTIGRESAVAEISRDY